jgi:tetratricopeptide (TPR) repeat protein
MDPNDFLLLKWLTAFQQELVAVSILKAILEFNQSEKMLNMKNQDDNSLYVLDNLSFDPSFSFVDTIKRLFKNYFISEVFSNHEKYIKLNYSSFLDENFIFDVERLKYRILILFSNQLEISIFNYEAFTQSIKTFYQCLITMLQQMESKSLDDVNFQIKISNLYHFIAVFNNFNLYDRNTQLSFMFKCNEIRKKHRLKYVDGDKRLSESINNTGVFYTETDLKKAIEFFVESLDLRLNDYLLNEKSTSSMHGICLMHNNLGKLYFDIGNKSKAHFHFQNVLAFSESLGKLPFVHLIQNISSLYEAEYAIKLLNMAVYVSNTRVDDEENLFLKSLMYLKMGINLDNLNKSNEALEAFDFALALSMYRELKYENKANA